MIEAPKVPIQRSAHVEVPIQFSRLIDVAYNFWWCWNQEAEQTFQQMDPVAWERYRNPIELLHELDAEAWYALQNDATFLKSYRLLVGAFDSYMMPTEPTWFAQRFPDFQGGPIAYFSTEYGWHESLQSYSGGLGVLSGDHSKSASDLGLPFVGIGLMYRRGYFHQTVDADGNQQHFYPNYDLLRLPLRLVRDLDGAELRVGLDFPDRRVEIRAWLAQVGRVPVLLLDTDLPENAEPDRSITSILYVNGREMRLCQELVLGMGGAKVLDKLRIVPSVWHMNEGHSALLSLERLRMSMASAPRPLSEALSEIASNAVFTTHTPVPAGNEVFDPAMVRRFVETWATGTDLPIDDLMSFGRGHDGEDGFNLTALAIRTSSRTNGVSKMHGEVASGIWKELLQNRPTTHVEHVTNGVHAPTWVGPEIGRLLSGHPVLRGGADDADGSLGQRVHEIPDDVLWSAHQRQKVTLLERMRVRLLEQRARHGDGPEQLRDLEHQFDPDTLLIGFARRFATYKRATLLLREMERFLGLVNNEGRPIQLLFAGKAHPADRPGQDLIREIWEASRRPELSRRLIFLENYDMRVGRIMVQGVDVWLNTPKRPMEASGTSGMKAAMNGALNCSILDGWWCEGYSERHGWAVNEQQFENDDEQAGHDANELYRLFEEIAGCYYDRNEAGVSAAWVARMKAAISELTPQFSTGRMVREYAERFYLSPAEVPATT